MLPATPNRRRYTRLPAWLEPSCIYLDIKCCNLAGRKSKKNKNILKRQLHPVLALASIYLFCFCSFVWDLQGSNTEQHTWLKRQHQHRSYSGMMRTKAQLGVNTTGRFSYKSTTNLIPAYYYIQMLTLYDLIWLSYPELPICSHDDISPSLFANAKR